MRERKEKTRRPQTTANKPLNKKKLDCNDQLEWNKRDKFFSQPLSIVTTDATNKDRSRTKAGDYTQQNALKPRVR